MRSLLAIAVALAACSPVAREIPLSFPPTTGNERALIAILTEGGQPALFAQSLEPWPDAIHLPGNVAADAPGTIEVVFYAASLAELAIPAGVLPIVQSGGRPLPEPSGVFDRDLAGTPEWRSVTWGAAPAAALSIADDRPKCSFCEGPSCGGLFSLPSTAGKALALLPLDPVIVETSFFGASPEQQFALGPDLAVRRLAVPRELEQTRASFRDPAGRLWFATENGLIVRAHLGSDQFVVDQVATSTPAAFNMIDGGLDAAGKLEIFAFGRPCVLWHVVPELGESTTIGSRSLDCEGREIQGSLIWLGPGRALLVFLHHPTVVWVDGDRILETPVDPAVSRPLESAALIPGLGIVVANDHGAVYLSAIGSDRGFSLLGVIDGIAIEKFLPYLDGFVFSGIDVFSTHGVVGQYRPTRGFCPPTRIGTQAWPFAAQAPNGDFLFAGPKRDGAPNGELEILHLIPMQDSQ
jgi:hypothetical protein